MVRAVGRCRSFRYLLSPTVRQRTALDELLGVQCELYNAALEERRGAWRWEHRSVSFFDQCLTLTSLRESRPEVLVAGVAGWRRRVGAPCWALSRFARPCR